MDVDKLEPGLMNQIEDEVLPCVKMHLKRWLQGVSRDDWGRIAITHLFGLMARLA